MWWFHQITNITNHPKNLLSRVNFPSVFSWYDSCSFKVFRLLHVICKLINGIIFQLSTRSPPTDRTATRTTATTEATATPGPPASDVDAAVTLATAVDTNHLHNHSLKSLTSYTLRITCYYHGCNTSHLFNHSLKGPHDDLVVANYTNLVSTAVQPTKE